MEIMATYIDFFFLPAGLCYRRSESYTSNRYKSGDKAHMIAEKY